MTQDSEKTYLTLGNLRMLNEQASKTLKIKLRILYDYIDDKDDKIISLSYKHLQYIQTGLDMDDLTLLNETLSTQLDPDSLKPDNSSPMENTHDVYVYEVELGKIRNIYERGTYILRDKLKFIQEFWLIKDTETLKFTKKDIHDLKKDLNPNDLELVKRTYQLKPDIKIKIGKLRNLYLIAQQIPTQTLLTNLKFVQDLWRKEDSDYLTLSSQAYTKLKSELTPQDIKTLPLYLED